MTQICPFGFVRPFTRRAEGAERRLDGPFVLQGHGSTHLIGRRERRSRSAARQPTPIRSECKAWLKGWAVNIQRTVSLSPLCCKGPTSTDDRNALSTCGRKVSPPSLPSVVRCRRPSLFSLPESVDGSDAQVKMYWSTTFDSTGRLFTKTFLPIRSRGENEQLHFEGPFSPSFPRSADARETKTSRWPVRSGSSWISFRFDSFSPSSFPSPVVWLRVFSSTSRLGGNGPTDKRLL